MVKSLTKIHFLVYKNIVFQASFASQEVLYKGPTVSLDGAWIPPKYVWKNIKYFCCQIVYCWYTTEQQTYSAMEIGENFSRAKSYFFLELIFDQSLTVENKFWDKEKSHFEFTRFGVASLDGLPCQRSGEKLSFFAGASPTKLFFPRILRQTCTFVIQRHNVNI